MIASAEASELHLLAILDFLCIAVAPFEWDIGVGISIDKNVECAVSVEHWQKSHRGRDLPEDGLDLCLDFRLGLLFWCIAGPINSQNLQSRPSPLNILWGGIFLIGILFGGL